MPTDLTSNKKTGPKGPSKPLSDSEFQQIIGMIEIACTRDEICSVLDMSDDTLNRRLKDRGEVNFAALHKKHSGVCNSSLRRLQWEGAKKGNVTMLIWLGKQWLGQTDKVENNGPGVTVNIAGPDADTL